MHSLNFQQTYLEPTIFDTALDPGFFIFAEHFLITTKKGKNKKISSVISKTKGHHTARTVFS